MKIAEERENLYGLPLNFIACLTTFRKTMAGCCAFAWAVATMFASTIVPIAGRGRPDSIASLGKPPKRMSCVNRSDRMRALPRSTSGAPRFWCGDPLPLDPLPLKAWRRHSGKRFLGRPTVPAARVCDCGDCLGRLRALDAAWKGLPRRTGMRDRTRFSGWIPVAAWRCSAGCVAVATLLRFR